MTMRQQKKSTSDFQLIPRASVLAHDGSIRGADGEEHCSRVLELGCGSGVPVARHLCKNMGSSDADGIDEYNGVDLSAKQLQFAREILPDTGSVVRSTYCCGANI